MPSADAAAARTSGGTLPVSPVSTRIRGSFGSEGKKRSAGGPRPARAAGAGSASARSGARHDVATGRSLVHGRRVQPDAGGAAHAARARRLGEKPRLIVRTGRSPRRRERHRRSAKARRRKRRREASSSETSFSGCTLDHIPRPPRPRRRPRKRTRRSWSHRRAHPLRVRGVPRPRGGARPSRAPPALRCLCWPARRASARAGVSFHLLSSSGGQNSTGSIAKTTTSPSTVRFCASKPSNLTLAARRHGDVRLVPFPRADALRDAKRPVIRRASPPTRARTPRTAAAVSGIGAPAPAPGPPPP